jgi:hypothetical protein
MTVIMLIIARTRVMRRSLVRKLPAFHERMHTPLLQGKGWFPLEKGVIDHSGSNPGQDRRFRFNAWTGLITINSFLLVIRRTCFGEQGQLGKTARGSQCG